MQVFKGMAHLGKAHQLNGSDAEHVRVHGQLNGSDSEHVRVHGN